jgi:hypothetical protein
MPDEAYWSGLEQRLLERLGREGLDAARRPAFRRTWRRWRLTAAVAAGLLACALGGYLVTRWLVAPRAALDELTAAASDRPATKGGAATELPWGSELPASGAPAAHDWLTARLPGEPRHAKSGRPVGQGGLKGGQAVPVAAATSNEAPLFVQELSGNALPVAALGTETDVITGTEAVLGQLGDNDARNLNGFLAARDQADADGLLVRLNELRQNAPPETARQLEPFELVLQRLGNLDAENVAREGPELQRVVRECELTARARLVRAELNR